VTVPPLRPPGPWALLLAAAVAGLPLSAGSTEAVLPETAASASGSAAAMPAAPQARAEAAPAPAAAGGVSDALQATRRAVRGATEWLAHGIDSWFGDKPFEEGGWVSDGRLSLHLYLRQGEDPDVRLRFGARMRLPNVEQQAGYLFVGRDDPTEVVKDRPDEVSQQQPLLRQIETDPSFFAGLGLTVSDLVDFRIGFRGGLNPFVQARYRQTWPLSRADLLEFRQTFFWSVDDRFGSTTTLAASHAFSPTLSSRWLNSTTITQDSRVFEWSSIVGTYQSFGGQRKGSLELIFTGEQNSGVPVSDYGLQAGWVQPIYEDWLLVEFTVGHFRPRDTPQDERGREWAVGSGLTMRF
jgi:hypothetical protein